MVNRVWNMCVAAAVVLLLSACSARSQTLPPTGSAEKQRIFIADRGNDRIVRLDDLTGVGRVTLGTRGSSKNQFSSPSSVFVDSRGRIYVADSGNARIVRVNDMTGAGWTGFRPRLKPGEPLWYPLGLAMDRLGHIYVTSLHSVFQMNDMDGSGWRTFGAMGSGPGQYALAASIFVDGDHRIYVADASIIPTALGVNPSLTISTLSLRTTSMFFSASLTPSPIVKMRLRFGSKTHLSLRP